MFRKNKEKSNLVINIREFLLSLNNNQKIQYLKIESQIVSTLLSENSKISGKLVVFTSKSRLRKML